MKKLFCVFISSVILFGVFILPSSAAETCGCGKTPVIMISGFAAVKLIKVNGDGSEETAFPFQADSIKKAVKDNISHFNPDKPFWFLGEMAAQVVDPIRMNEDGTSYYNIKPPFSAAKDTSLAAFIQNGTEYAIPYNNSVFLDMRCLADEVGDDHVFNFLFDWRISSDIVADELYAYIKDVLKTTGHKKVSLYCLSQGSVCAAQYLYKYADKALLDNVVFDNPIFTGSDLVADVYDKTYEEYSLDFSRALDIYDNIAHTEKHLSRLGGKVPDVANFVAKFGADNFILPLVKASPAYLEMLPEDRYDEICGMYDFSPELLETVDKVRNGYMKDVAATLRGAEKYGATVSIVACSGFGLATGTKEQSDSIVNVSSSCGAYCSNTPFPDNYVQKKDLGHYCISPDRTIDLSAGFLPERTWIVNELNHGQVEWAERSLSLLMKLLFTHEIKDAWSTYEFPQFMQSNDPGNDIHARFIATNSLLTKRGASGTVEITNVSRKNKICLNDFKVFGAKITADFELPVVLAPGETLTFEIDTITETNGTLTFSYCESNAVFTGKEKTFDFSVIDDFPGIVSKTEYVSESGGSHGFQAKLMSFLNSLFN